MKISILHLKDGYHLFEDRFSPQSLDFKERKFYQNTLHVQVKLNKYEKNIECEVKIQTAAIYECDRCVEMYEVPVEIQFNLLLRPGKEPWKNQEDVIHLTSESSDVDLKPWITEQLILAVPMKKLCRENCKGFCAGCGTDLNAENCCCGEKPIDPRWEKLKELLTETQIDPEREKTKNGESKT